MPSSLSAARCPSCLSLLARRAAAATRPVAAPWLQLQQTRGKKTGRRGDRGVVVRLLQDVAQFGRADTILRADRGRMRNLWYPNKMAEYMTTARLAALGLTAETAVVERDPFFAVAEAEAAAAAMDVDVGVGVDGSVSARSAVPLLDPSRAADLLADLLPSALVFHRKPIAPDAPALFGSVTADDIAAAVRDILRTATSTHADAALVRIDPRDVRFLGAEAADHDSALDPATDRIKALGRWRIEIAVRGGGDPVPRIVEVVPEPVE